LTRNLLKTALWNSRTEEKRDGEALEPKKRGASFEERGEKKVQPLPKGGNLGGRTWE